MKKIFKINILIIITMLVVFLSLFNFSTKAIVDGNIGLEKHWGIGYKIKNESTVPLIGFKEPNKKVSKNSSDQITALKNDEYNLFKGSVNIHIQKLEDLYIVFDLNYGDNDEKIVNSSTAYYYDFYKGNSQFNREVLTTNDKTLTFHSKSYNILTDKKIEFGFHSEHAHELFVEGASYLMINFNEFIKEEFKDNKVIDFSLRVQNIRDLRLGFDERYIELDIKIIIDTENPIFQNYFAPFGIINNSDTIYTKSSYSFKVVDKIVDQINQISSLTCKKDSNPCTNISIPSYPNILGTVLNINERIELTQDGFYEFIATDLAGNQSILKIIIDKTGPEVVTFKENNSTRNVIDNESYSQGINLTLRDTSNTKQTTVKYSFNGVTQPTLTFNQTNINLSNYFLRDGEYQILYIEDYLGNKTVFSNNQTTIKFLVDRVGPYYDGEVVFILENQTIQYNKNNVRLKFFDNENGSGIFEIMYYHIINSVSLEQQLPNRDIFQYYIFGYEGHNLVIVKDKAGNELRLEFYIDKTAPAVIGFANQNIIYLNQSQNIEFFDNLSGINFEDSTVKFNQQTNPLTLLSNLYEIKEEGKYTFHVMDKVGNSIDIIVFFDNTNPSISTQSIDNGIYKDYYNEPFLLKYTDSENGSGIKTFLYLENNEWKTIQKRDIDHFFNSSRASGYYSFKVIDFLDNESEILNIKYDPIKPDLISDKYIIKSGINYFNVFDMTFSVFDNFSGIKTVKVYEFNFEVNEYILKINDKNGIDILNYQILNQKEGKFKIEVIDNADNLRAYEVVFDSTPPILNGLENDAFISEWINNVNFYFSDDISGIAYIEYAYEDSDYQPFINFLLFISEGQYKLRVYDNSGNNSFYTLHYDFNNPTVEGIVNNTKTNTPINLYFSDNYSGFKLATIKLNGEYIDQNYTETSYLAVQDGMYELTVYDNAERSSKIIFTIDQKSPELLSSLSNDDYIILGNVFEYVGSETVVIYNYIDVTTYVESVVYSFNEVIMNFELESTLKQGNHKFVITDVVGNVASYIFKIDIDEFPTLYMGNTQILEGLLYINSFTTFNAFDEISGIYQVLNNDLLASKTFSIDSDGIYNIKIVDKVGLESNYTVIYDSIQPEFDINLFENTLKTSEFKILDDLSGIFKLEYRMNLQSDWLPYSFDQNYNVYIVDNGEYFFRLTDNALNSVEITFVADIVFTNIEFIGNLINKVDNKYNFNTFVELDFSKIEESYTYEIKDGINFEKLNITNSYLEQDGVYLITVINEFNNKSNYLITIDTKPIDISEYDNNFYNTSLSIDINDLFEEISEVKIEFCIYYNHLDCSDISESYFDQLVLSFDNNGIYLVTITDNFLNSSTIKFSIDTSKPSIELIGNEKIELDYLEIYEDSGVIVYDNFDSFEDLEIIIYGDLVDNSTLGTYIVYYQVMDKSGNYSVEISRTVEVKDLSKPEVFLTGDAEITIEAGNEYIDLGATYLDNYDGSGDALSIGNVDVNVIGSYKIEYSYTDSNGNFSEIITRNVFVVDTVFPVVKVFNTLNNQEVEINDSIIYVNHSIKFDISDYGTGIKSIKLNGNTFNSQIIATSGTYKLEVIDNASNKYELFITLDNTNPVIDVNVNNNSTIINNTIYGIANIQCSDEHTEVECYINGELTTKTFKLFIPGDYLITAIDQLSNQYEKLISIELPFDNLKSLYWYEFENLKFREISDIIDYIKIQEKFDYQIVNNFSYNDLKIRMYEFPAGLPNNLNQKREFYLLNFVLNADLDYSKLAFVSVNDLETFITQQLNNANLVKIYGINNQNSYVFDNNFYVYNIEDFDIYLDFPIIIKDIESNVVFNDVYNGEFIFKYDNRYSIELVDDKSSYLYYFEWIKEKKVTFEIERFNQSVEIVNRNDNNFVFKEYIEIQIGNYHFDTVVEVSNGVKIESFIIKSNEFFVLSNKDNSLTDYKLFNGEYNVKVYFLNRETNDVVIEELFLKLIDPSKDLPFKVQKLVSWYEFNGLSFFKVIDIVDYMKRTAIFDYQVTINYSLKEITQNGYIFSSIVEDENLKREYYLIIDSENKKRAFLNEEDLNLKLAEILTANLNLKKSFSSRVGKPEEINVFYDHSKELFDIFFNNVPLKIYDFNNNLVFEDIYESNFNFGSSIYKIEVIDTVFDKPYSFYFNILIDNDFLYQVNDITNGNIIDVKNTSELTLKTDVNFLIGNYNVDVIIEIYNYSDVLLVPNKTLILNAGETISISRDDLIQFTKSGLESNSFIIKTHYFDGDSNSIISRELKLILIDPELEIKINKDNSKQHEFKFNVSFNKDDSTDFYKITDIYLLYCDSNNNCETPETIQIKGINKTDLKSNIDFTIDFEKDKDYYSAGYYKVIVLDNTNTTSITEFNYSNENNGGIPPEILILVGLIGLLVFAIDIKKNFLNNMLIKIAIPVISLMFIVIYLIIIIS